MADTFAVRQSEGKTVVSNDRWKMSLSAGARVSAQSVKMTLGIWSGPHALWGLMALSNLHTPAVLMLISLIIGCCGGSRCGEADPPSLVKTLWNCIIDLFPFGFTHTSPTCFLDEFVVCPVVCFLSFLIVFSFALVVDAAYLLI